MIALDIKQQNSAELPALNISPKEEEPTLSFASLLKSVKDVKKELTTLEGSAVTLVLEDIEPKETITLKSSQKSDKNSNKKELLSLVQTQEKESVKKDDTALELNPKITQTTTSKELKVVIENAKQYLKSQIMESDAFKKKEIDSLPKTLKGLSQVAKKVGIDVTKITLEQVQESSSKVKSSEKSEIKTLKISAATNEKNQELESVTPKESKVTTASLNIRQDKRALTQAEPKVIKESTAFEEKEEPKVPKREIGLSLEKKSVTQTPLFKAQTQTKTEMTTQELVAVKSFKQDPTSKKEKSEQTLELLLRGEKVSQTTNSTVALTTDFSVATAKVIAPGITTQNHESLESLLNGTSSKDELTHEKSEMVHVAKSDSFEVKLGEAKQMMKYLSQDIKTAIEDYKSPFTRVKVQLNPQKLGEVDLTIVQRGKNLHINLSSNNAAINTLAMNANDLKTQLNNSGINNASLNFNNNSQTSDGSFGSQTQQQHQQREEAQSKYNYFAQQENNEEIVSSLEIVVPYYA